MAHEAGKGSKPRPYKTDTYRQNYERIFRRDRTPEPDDVSDDYITQIDADLVADLETAAAARGLPKPDNLGSLTRKDLMPAAAVVRRLASAAKLDDDGKRQVASSTMLSPIVRRRLLTDYQAAEYLNLCSRSVHNLVSRKMLPSLKIGRSRRFDVADLDRLIESRKVLPSGWKETKGRKRASA